MNMRSFAATVVYGLGVLADAAVLSEAAAILPVSGPFHLTAVPANGSEPYPIGTMVVSRGAEILVSARAYTQRFTYDRYVHNCNKISP
jgi:hypothetical protein